MLWSCLSIQCYHAPSTPLLPPAGKFVPYSGYNAGFPLTIRLRNSIEIPNVCGKDFSDKLCLNFSEMQTYISERLCTNFSELQTYFSDNLCIDLSQLQVYFADKLCMDFSELQTHVSDKLFMDFFALQTNFSDKLCMDFPELTTYFSEKLCMDFSFNSWKDFSDKWWKVRCRCWQAIKGKMLYWPPAFMSRRNSAKLCL